MLSPGIDPDSPLARNFSVAKIETIGELELGWRSCDVPVIAITGTNGKTTTTELLAQMLNACGQSTIACGNIGKPLSEVAREERRFDVLTVEVSSFQLETIRDISSGDQRLAEFRAGPSRSLSLGRGISRGQAPDFREPDAEKIWRLSTRAKRCRRSRAPNRTFQRLRRTRGFPFGRRLDRLRQPGGAALADTKLRGLA